MQGNIMQEQLLMSEFMPLKVREFDYKHFTYPWHFHSEYEIIYIRQGTGNLFAGNYSGKFSDGDIIIIGSNLPHYLKNDEQYHAPENELRVTGTIIQFEKDFLYSAIQKYPQFIKIKKLLEESMSGILIAFGSDEETVKLMQNIPSFTGMDQLICFLELLKKMSLIKNRILLTTFDTMTAPYEDLRIDKIISFLNKNYNRTVTLKEISSLAAMNPAAFCRYFKQKTGKTFIHYILEMRINFACKLLMMDSQNMTQISLICGYETISNFNKSFKKITGITPTRYREIMK